MDLGHRILHSAGLEGAFGMPSPAVLFLLLSVSCRAAVAVSRLRTLVPLCHRPPWQAELCPRGGGELMRFPSLAVLPAKHSYHAP